jgi:hypothetical protein
MKRRDFLTGASAFEGKCMMEPGNEAPLGVLKRFFPDNTQIVDLTRSGWPLGKDDCMHQRSLSYQVIP